MRTVIVVGCCFGLLGCGESASETGLRNLPLDAQAISLFGDTLYPPTQPAEVRQGNTQRLDEARESYEADRSSADALIWLGRRTAYLGRYREAIGVFSQGIADHPGDARMYRHRGHRYVTVRRFDMAIRDLEQAAELVRGQVDQVEPDGLPNARNIPTSTLQFNIWYHLGLAYYLTDDMENALRAYRECWGVSKNPDSVVAASYWLYMILRRLGRDDDAATVLDGITPAMDIIENESYRRLLLLNKQELAEEGLLDTRAEDDVPLANATVGYGIGQWHAMNGRPADAERVWRTVLSGSQWAAFGFIAAEAEIARMESR